VLREGMCHTCAASSAILVDISRSVSSIRSTWLALAALCLLSSSCSCCTCFGVRR